LPLVFEGRTIEVTWDGESVILQWVQDSAYRYVPLVEHEEFDLTLHPVDLATNKILALVGFSLLSIIEHAARSSRYSAVEVSSLSFEGPPPSAAHLS
jgi:hypothetical protein